MQEGLLGVCELYGKYMGIVLGLIGMLLLDGHWDSVSRCCHNLLV